MKRLTAINSINDIHPKYRNTPVEKLLASHNLDMDHDPEDKADMLIALCMDNRKKLRIPENFAYILRTGGVNLRNNEFKISYTIGVGGISAIALIAHNNCGMVNLKSKKEIFVNGLVEKAGWDRKSAEEHFDQYSPRFEIGNEIDFVLSETERLRQRYPKILIAPLFYKLEDNLLYLIEE
ncbi:MAG: carbonic anhydrase [Candidatus Margulisiibacteriota bacterium]